MSAETGWRDLIASPILIRPQIFCTLRLASASSPQRLSRLGIHLILRWFPFDSLQVYTGMQWWEILTHRGPIAQWALPAWKTLLPVRFSTLRL